MEGIGDRLVVVGIHRQLEEGPGQVAPVNLVVEDTVVSVAVEDKRAVGVGGDLAVALDKGEVAED